jgi:hypothetical protein
MLGCGLGPRAEHTGGYQGNERQSSVCHLSFSLAQTLPLLPELELEAGCAHPAKAASEEGSLEEEAPPMSQGSGPGAPQAPDSTDLDVPTEAVTCEL